MSRRVVDDTSATECAFGKEVWGWNGLQNALKYPVFVWQSWNRKFPGKVQTSSYYRRVSTLFWYLKFLTFLTFYRQFQPKIPDSLDKKISHIVLHTMDHVNPEFLKHVIVTISILAEWDHLKKILFIIEMVSMRDYE